MLKPSVWVKAIAEKRAILKTSLDCISSVGRFWEESVKELRRCLGKAVKECMKEGPWTEKIAKGVFKSRTCIRVRYDLRDLYGRTKRKSPDTLGIYLYSFFMIQRLSPQKYSCSILIQKSSTVPESPGEPYSFLSSLLGRGETLATRLHVVASQPFSAIEPDLAPVT